MKKKIKLSIIILVKNEEKSIAKEIEDINRIIISKIKNVEFIITQDGSIDKSDKIIKSLKKKFKIKYYSFRKRLGVHNALLFSLKKARGDHIFFMDSGGKFLINEFFKIYKFKDKFDIVSGLRINRQDQIYRILLTYFFNLFLRIFTISKVRDLDSGFKLFKRKTIRKSLLMKKLNSHFFMSEICLKSIYMGHKFKEVKVNYFQRETVSRATSITKIPAMILSFLLNFKQLKKMCNEFKQK